MPKSTDQKHKYIDLIEFALANRSFTVQQALDATKMSADEFSAAKYSLFHLKGMHENPDRNKVLDWTLRPEAYFHYLSFLEFRHSVRAARKAFWLAVASICIAIASAVLTGIALL